MNKKKTISKKEWLCYNSIFILATIPNIFAIPHYWNTNQTFWWVLVRIDLFIILVVSILMIYFNYVFAKQTNQITIND